MKKVVSILLVLMMLMSTLVVTASAAYENTYTNTGNQRVDIVGVAKTQLGCTDKYKYNNPNGYAWCAFFVVWCARQANIDSSIIRTSGVACAEAGYLNVPYYSRTSHSPQSGDLVFFNWPSTSDSWDHVGIVEYVESNGTVHTIEGNSNNRVQRCSYSANGTSESNRLSSIRGYGVPKYKGEGVHVHDYLGEGNEQLHPHKIYRICECGDWYYTGSTTKRSDCLECYPTTLKVYYNANGGSISSDTYKLSSNVVCNKSDSAKYVQTWTYNKTKEKGLTNSSTLGLYKTGYTFAGWGTSASGGTVFDHDDATVKPTDINANIKNGDCSATLYAQWTPNVLTVAYNANGGSITSDTYKLSSNVLYYKTDGTKATQSWSYGKTKENGLTNAGTFGIYKTGYTFAGWGTSASGGTVFSQSDNTLTAANINSNIKNGNCSSTLYAQWTANTLTINYHINGGSINSEKYKLNSNILAYTSNGKNVDDNWTYNSPNENGLYNPGTFGIYKTGYKFSGWGTTSAGGTVFDQNNVELKPTEINANIKNGNCSSTLYAQWTANSYAVSFNGNGSTGGSMSNLTMSYGTAKALTANAFTKTGYTFNGWNTKADGTGTAYANKASVKNLTSTNGGTVTLYAQWEANTLTVNYHINGGSINSEKYKLNSNLLAFTSSGKNIDDTWTYNSPNVNGLYNPSTFGIYKTGYKFSGWGTTSTGGTIFDQNNVELKPTEINANIKNGNCSSTLYAQWTANSYKIAFNGNGSTSGSMSNLTMSYGTAKALAANAFTKTGYTFNGWNTKADGTGTAYADKTSVKNLTSTSGGTVTLYAQWTPITYTVSFDANGGNVDTSSSVVGYGESVKLLTPDKTYSITYNVNSGTGSFSAQTAFVECLGWSTSKTASSADYVCGASYKPSSDTTLYAVWNPYSSKILSSAKPTRVGYTFLGWSQSSTATIAEFLPSEKVDLSGDITLYAVWQKLENPTDTPVVVYKTVQLDYKEEYQIKTDGFEAGRFIPEKDSEVLTVDSDGTVTALTTGSSTVYVYDSDNHLCAVYTFEVDYASWQWLIIIFLFGWIWYI